MNTQKVKNKKIIGLIYGLLYGLLILGALFLVLSVGLFLLNYFNPELDPFFPIVDIPLNINLPGILELKDGTIYNIIIDDAFVSFNINEEYGLPGIINFIHFFSILAIAYYVIYLLWKIFKSIKSSLKDENPFQPKNIWRIRLIAIAVFVSALLEISYPLILKYFWFKNLTISGQVFDFRLSFDAVIDFLWVLIILVVAEIYRIGSEIKKEQELTI
ncbi:MAG: hypothetical protein A2X13_11910 [Bacteroidetes bacterium GWC2_33_15]|nr:MAG: hypothetical protein A2X10_05935 [Bacteroidetes bacterium GWA2_33_15]OFX50840.1 MAG: hypothetical protein A2X13_11910 [Bacteroidetes bacterium GWC2_33_15]OFX62877.1 MAG: hypothetical protein A2X15_09460 [Bacteroidetes bacterium GWB2_32_14]OFX69947.1 MAG: hypothetical protein A2X14_02320 [Bacteroidetes bacterium GWD2_33_33]HAN18939.1 hypothetical protein [Bacteroidales bacterium]